MHCIKSVFPVTLVKICTVCHRFVTPTKPGLRCNGLCREYYHHGCVSTDYARLGTMCAALNIDWSCIKCKMARAKILGPSLPGWNRRRKSLQNMGKKPNGSCDLTSAKSQPDIHLADAVMSRYDSIDRQNEKRQKEVVPTESVSKFSQQKVNIETSNIHKKKSSKDSNSTQIQSKKEKVEKVTEEPTKIIDETDAKKSSKEKRKRFSIDRSSDSSSARKKSEKSKKHTVVVEVEKTSDSLDSSNSVSSKKSSKSNTSDSEASSLKQSSYFLQDPQKLAENAQSEKLETVSKEAKKDVRKIKIEKEVEEYATSVTKEKPVEEKDKIKSNKGKFLDAIMKEVQDYKQTQDDLLSSIMFITSAFHDLSTIMSVMKENTEDIKKLREENTYLKSEIKDICSKLESMQHEVTSDLKAKKYLDDGDENIIMNITTKIRNKIDIQEE